jgi:hypothetical protein
MTHDAVCCSNSKERDMAPIIICPHWLHDSEWPLAASFSLTFIISMAVRWSLAEVFRAGKHAIARKWSRT